MDLKNREKLKKSGTLKQKGVITKEAFETQKEALLRSSFLKKTHETHIDYSCWHYFKLCVTKKYADIKGRARRKEYFGFAIWVALISTIFNFLASLAGSLIGGIEYGLITGAVSQIIMSLIFFTPSLCAMIRRMHDINRSGFWVAPLLILNLFSLVFSISLSFIEFSDISLTIITAIALILLIMSLPAITFIFFKSDMEANKYGDVPEGVY